MRNEGVIEIDGVNISDIDLSESTEGRESQPEEKNALNHYEVCPACETKIVENEQYCMGCGLKLMD